MLRRREFWIGFSLGALLFAGSLATAVVTPILAPEPAPPTLLRGCDENNGCPTCVCCPEAG